MIGIGLELDRCLRDSFGRFRGPGFAFPQHRELADVEVVLLPYEGRYLVVVQSRHFPQAAVYYHGRFLTLIQVEEGYLTARQQLADQVLDGAE